MHTFCSTELPTRMVQQNPMMIKKRKIICRLSFDCMLLCLIGVLWAFLNWKRATTQMISVKKSFGGGLVTSFVSCPVKNTNPRIHLVFLRVQPRKMISFGPTEILCSKGEARRCYSTKGGSVGDTHTSQGWKVWILLG